MQRKQFPPRFVDPVNFGPGEDEEEDEEEEFDLIAAMNEMTVTERRKVYALMGLLNDFKAVRTKFREELAVLQLEHLRAAQQLHDVRAEIVRGVRDVTDEEVKAVTVTTTSGVQEIPSSDDDDKKSKNEKGDAAGSEAPPAKAKKSVKVVTMQEEKSRLEAAASVPDGGIPDFWLTALCNSEVIESMITERDRHALGFLQDIRMEYIDSDPQKGVRLNFHFAPNEYFTNTVLSKTFRMTFDDDSGEMEIDSMKATPVEWKSPEKNLTVILKNKKQRHKTSKSIRVVTREEKCPSFFTFFTDPLGDEDEDEDEEEEKKEGKEGKNDKKDAAAVGKKKTDEDDEDEDEEAELHIEVGQLLMEEIIPKAAFFYTGKSVDQTAKALESQLNFQLLGLGDGDEGDEDDDDDDEDDVPPARRRLAQRGEPAGKGQQDCKQQ